ncbi:hypothetical protein C8Q75DRAFT_563697 [Abortiporus biennis]|nr:hypothetical protein C8Q75DRAFT_563697 [Abortiporus biennis]
MDNTHFCRCVDDKYVEWGSVDFTLVLSFLQVSSVGCQNARMPRPWSPTDSEWSDLEEEWMYERRTIHEVYEYFTPRFTVPNPRLRSPQLPPEICLSILDFVGDRGDSSRQLIFYICSLTCRAFFHRSRRYLYETIRFYDSDRFQSFLKSITQWVHLRELTTEIEFNQHNVKDYHQLFLRGPKLLPNLQLLSLTHMPLLHPSIVNIRRPFRSVTSLSIQNSSFSSILDIRRLIDSHFPRLSSLELRELELHSLFVILPKPWPRKALSLSKLEMSFLPDNHIGPVQQWLLSTPTLTSIHSLNIPAEQSYVEMLAYVGQHLQTLILCWTWKYETSEKISLQPGLLPILKTLVIVAGDQWEIPNFCSAFAGHRFSSTLSCIRIWIMVRAPAGGKEYDLLDDTLAVLPSRIRIEIGSHYWSYLPKRKSKGVLVVPSVPYGA